MIKSAGVLEWVPLERWGLAWRFLRDTHRRLDTQTLATIRPLSERSAIQLGEAHSFGEVQHLAETNQLGTDWTVQSIDFDNLQNTKDAIRSLRATANDDVYVVWAKSDGAAAVVAWQTFCNHFDDFWYEFEIVLVTDDTGHWEILLGPNPFVCWRGFERTQ